MSTAQFKKRTTHLKILGKYDLCQHVVKTCPFCNSVTPRPKRSRVSGLREEEFGDLIFLDHGSAKIGDKTFGFLIMILEEPATSHLTACPCERNSKSEVIAQIHEWMDTFQMNPKAICADMAFHQPHVLHAFYRMHNVKRLPTRPHAPWPNRAEMGVRLSKKFLLALVDTASKNMDQNTLAQITSAQLMCKAATVRNTQVTSSGKTSTELAMRQKPRDLLDPASMNPEQLTSTSTMLDPLNEEIQKLAMRTHLEVQQREDIRRDLAERMKFVYPDLHAGEHAFHWQEDPSKIQQGGNHCSQGHHGCCQYRCDHISGKCGQAEETVGHYCGFGRTCGLA